MLTGSELALDRAQIERSMNRETAIMAKATLQGYKFIRLKLKNIRRRKIVGIDAVVAQEYQNEEMGGITDYFLEVKGGEINFQYRPELGMYTFDMLDTERNREFLATHIGGDYWEILDKRVESAVIRRAEMIADRLRGEPQKSDTPSEFWTEVRASEAQALRAARGEIEIPKATVLKENPLDPAKTPVHVPYVQPKAPKNSKPLKPIKHPPKLWKELDEENAEQPGEPPEDEGTAVEQTLPPDLPDTPDAETEEEDVFRTPPQLGVGVLSP